MEVYKQGEEANGPGIKKNTINTHEKVFKTDPSQRFNSKAYTNECFYVEFLLKNAKI